MLAGTLSVETFNFGVGDADFPLYDNGEPKLDADGAHATAPFKILAIEALPGFMIELRIPVENWPVFLAGLAEKPVIEKATMQDVKRLGAAR